MSESVCVGCRFAQWKDDQEWERRWGQRYGQCQHPVAVLLRSKMPGCVQLDIPLNYDIHVDSISTTMGVGYCETREES